MTKASPRLVHEAYGEVDAPVRSTPARTWDRTYGTYIAGRAALDEADALANELEAKWGCDRLRLLVPAEMREKFDRQRFLLNRANRHGDLEDVRREAGRMVKAWATLDRLATEAGKAPLPREVWEVPLADGSVAAIVPDDIRARLVLAEGRQVSVYTLEEIGRLLDGYPGLAKAKATFPGATVVEVRRRRAVDDPLEGIGETSHGLDDDLNDPLGF